MRFRIIENINPEFLEAVKNTQGADITKNGIEMDISRYQKPEQHGVPSIRKAVFYLPEKDSPYKKYYSTGKMGYGGAEKVTGRTVFKNPLIVKAGTGGRAISLAYDQIEGKGAYEKMRRDVLQKAVMNSYTKTNNEQLQNVIEVLEKYGGDADLADEILAVSTVGNTLAYAVQEHIAGEAIRSAGYDAVISYSKANGQPRLSEVFDVRAFDYPYPGQVDFNYEDFYKDFELKKDFMYSYTQQNNEI